LKAKEAKVAEELSKKAELIRIQAEKDQAQRLL